MNDPKKTAILLVDDEEDFLDIVTEFLVEQGYDVTCAQNGDAALEALGRKPFDLLLSDINMPGMKGFELLKIAAERFPRVKRALITAYDVNDYIALARDHDVGNIITKTMPFNFAETGTLIRTIVTEDVFGLGRYVGGTVHAEEIRASPDIERVIDRVIEALPEPLWKRRFRHGLVEAIINAVYYGAKHEQGDRKEEWSHDLTLAPDEYVLVSWAFDDQKAGISVTDQKGRLTKRDVLYWLERNMTRDSRGLTLGFFDKHGKGLFISRQTNDRFIINTKRGERTEVIMINYKEGLYHGHRPLWIHEF
jgi:CheY-like chemotaxis protein